MTKNKPNAQHGDEPKSSYLHMRVTQGQKAQWVKQAQARGMKLSAWVCEKLGAAEPERPPSYKAAASGAEKTPLIVTEPDGSQWVALEDYLKIAGLR